MEESPTSLHALLRQAQFTAGLAPDVIDALAQNARLFRARPGTVLFQEDTHQDDIFILVAGRAALEMAVPRRGNVRLLTVGAGELIGWSGLIGEGEMTATAVITVDATLIGLSSTKLLELSEQNPRFGYQLMLQTAKAVSRRLLATRLQLLDLFSETERLSPPGN